MHESKENSITQLHVLQTSLHQHQHKYSSVPQTLYLPTTELF